MSRSCASTTPRARLHHRSNRPSRNKSVLAERVHRRLSRTSVRTNGRVWVCTAGVQVAYSQTQRGNTQPLGSERADVCVWVVWWVSASGWPRGRPALRGCTRTRVESIEPCGAETATAETASRRLPRTVRCALIGKVGNQQVLVWRVLPSRLRVDRQLRCPMLRMTPSSNGASAAAADNLWGALCYAGRGTHAPRGS